MAELETDVAAFPEIDDVAGRIITHGPYTLTDQGVVVTDQESLQLWLDAFEWCWRVKKAAGFWLGDLAILGEKYGEAASQILEQTGYAERTITNAKVVAKAIEPTRRRVNVPFSIHVEVAKLSPEMQDEWLEKAENENLTVDDVRRGIKVETAIAQGKTLEYFVTVVCTDQAHQAQLAEQMKTAGLHVKLGHKEILG